MILHVSNYRESAIDLCLFQKVRKHIRWEQVRNSKYQTLRQSSSSIDSIGNLTSVGVIL